MTNPVWDPQAYLRFEAERARPWFDLLARVEALDPRRVVDLGCGPGHLTADLARRWPGAEVLGFDSSAEMVARARAEVVVPRVRFEVVDARAWRAPEPVDVLVSNAVLQWIPGHVALLPSLVAQVAVGGWLAVQVPANFGAATHALVRELRARPGWVGRVPELVEPGSEPPQRYLEVLAGAGCRVDVWQTEYLHVLAGEDAVLRWMEGTGLRPVLQALGAAEAEEFRAQYGELLREAYPRRDFGTVLPYRRTFAVAQRVR
ncbi:methyltransferase domain-containing protein [Kineococcus glutinatus]|uniref:Trans-aconitate 2-methyltransferase n=1 Tax=Kineococcus glutinatus TaxID=1070872 RepID=A0ABP9I5U9_9ACTN